MAKTYSVGVPSLAGDLRLPPQPRRILAHLMKGKSITPMESEIVYGIYRLSDCIFKIRRAGHKVKMEIRKDEAGHKYARYSLEK